MKKFFMTSLITVFVLTLLTITNCGKEEKATLGTEGEVNLLSMLPDNASGVVFVNFKKLAELKFFDKMIKDADEKKIDKPGEVFKNYQDFVDKTGIDPKKDIHAIAIAFLGKIGPGESNVVIVVNMNYTENKILTSLKDAGKTYAEEQYKDIAIYKVKDEHGEEGVFSFLSDNVIAGGKIDGVKKVIDLSKGTGVSILENAKLKPYIEKFKPGNLISFVIDLPEDTKKAHDMGMAKMDLSKAEVVEGYLDCSGGDYTGKFVLISRDKDANKQVESALNMVKGLAGVILGPEGAELAENINVSSSADEVKLTFSFSEELLEKLKKKMEEKAKGVVPAPPTTTD